MEKVTSRTRFRFFLSFWMLIAGTHVWAAKSQVAKMPAEGSPKTFQNPILSGFHPDPSICRVGEDFYLVNSTFEYFPGLPIYHSRDLTHWEQIGNVLDRPSQVPLSGATDFGGNYAPTIRYWKGKFYVTCTNYNGKGAYIVTAQDPRGPWSEPVWLGTWNMDGSMFFDDDGKAYFTQHAGGEKAGISQAEFDPETCLLTTTPKVIHNDLSEAWNEGPHLYKVKGKYYLMVAEGGTGDQHMEWIGRSHSPWGPFEPCPSNPILTERDDPKSPIRCTGHGDLVEAPDGSWWMVFLGVRSWNRGNTSVLGRETFLAPVVWKDGWPVVNGDHHVALEMPAPKLKAHPCPTPGPRWEFNETKLGPEWIHVRNLDPKDLSLEKHAGSLSLRAAKASLTRKEGNPAFAGQRQPDFKVTARCAMDFTPAVDGEEAGLMVRANDDNHYEVGVGRWEGKTCLFARNHVKKRGCLVAQEPFAGGRVFLELSGREEQYRFAWSADGKTWKTLAASDASDLSKDKAGGFTGAAIGLYATANGKESGNWSRFDWFEMRPGVAPEAIELSARPTPVPLPPREVWRVHSGGEALTDSAGNVWSEDVNFNEGQTAGWGTVEAEKDAALYQTERWGSDFSYVFPVLPGAYQVRLLFAENLMKEPGKRVFDVLLNGKTVLADFDILKEAGFNRGIERTFKEVAPDVMGNIRVRFVSKVDNGKVSAIEVVRTSTREGKAVDAGAGNKVLKVDDFESEKPAFGNGWWSGCDQNNLGTTLQPQPFERLSGGSSQSQGFCAGIKGHLGKAVAPWPWASLNLGLGQEAGVDLNAYQAVRFNAKGDGKTYSVSLARAAVTDYAGFSASFTASKDWAPVTILFEEFKQPDWGKKLPRAFPDVKSLGFSPTVNNEDYDLMIDDVEFLK